MMGSRERRRIDVRATDNDKVGQLDNAVKGASTGIIPEQT